MRYVKMLGLLAMAAAAMMALAGSASAGIFQIEKEGPAWTGEIHAVAGETTLHGAATITCTSSTVAGKVEQHGSDPITGKGKIETLTFTGCGTNHVTVVEKGSLEIHTHPADAKGIKFGIVTSTGATINIQITSLGITCGFKTNETEVGTLTNSTHRHVTIGEGKDTAETATIHIDSVKIPRHSGSIFCGSTGEWTGTYEVTTPDYLDYT